MVRLTVAGVLIQHVWSASLNLRVDDLFPEPACLDLLSSAAFALIRRVESLELLTPTLEETWTFIGAHKGPLFISLDTLHEEVGNPEGVEEITSTVLFSSIVLSKLQELVDIRVPRLEVNCKCAFPLAATLVDIPCSIIVYLEHGDETIRIAVCASNVRGAGSDAVHSETNTTSVLGDHCSLLQSVVDTLNRVLAHGKKEAGAHLRPHSSTVEQGGSRVREPLLAHQVVGLKGALKVIDVNTDRAAHQQVLRSLSNLSIDAQQVRLLKCLIAEEVVGVVPRVVDHLVDSLIVLFDDLIDFVRQKRCCATGLIFLCVQQISYLQNAVMGTLVQTLDRDCICKFCVFRVHDGHVGACLSCEIRDLSCCHT